MDDTCRRCGARAVNGQCTLCGSTQVDAVSAPPGPPPTTAATPQQPAIAAPAPAPTRSSPPPAAQRSRSPLVLGIIAAVAVIGIVGWFLSSSATRTGIATPAAPPQQASPAATLEPEPTIAAPVASAAPEPQQTPTPVATADTASVEAAALTELTSLAAADGPRADRNGQWVAQLASKWVGVEDLRLTTVSGSHVFQAVDILAEHQQLRARFPNYEVVLLDSRTYGKRRHHDGEAIWVTMVVNQGFTSEEQVLAWCGAQYPGLTGKDLLNNCMPNRLNP